MGEWTLGSAAAALSGVSEPVSAEPTLSSKGKGEPEVKGSDEDSPIRRLEASNHPVAKVALAKTMHKAGGKIVAGITEIIAVEWAQKPNDDSIHGYDVDEPDDDDLQMLEDATAAGLESQWPDANVPWWLGMLFAAGNVVVGVRRSRKPRITPRIEGKKAEKKPEPPKVQEAPMAVTEGPKAKETNNAPEGLDDKPLGT